ncbi:hypothetical protein HDU99_002893 [Rhizoclosmatium hyalinum]|nr:hypothetical protein HDU99_002893 [Rhizoclosmatium hyalinum]
MKQADKTGGTPVPKPPESPMYKSQKGLLSGMLRSGSGKKKKKGENKIEVISWDKLESMLMNLYRLHVITGHSMLDASLSKPLIEMMRQDGGIEDKICAARLLFKSLPRSNMLKLKMNLCHLRRLCFAMDEYGESVIAPVATLFATIMVTQPVVQGSRTGKSLQVKDLFGDTPKPSPDSAKGFRMLASPSQFKLPSANDVSPLSPFAPKQELDPVKAAELQAEREYEEWILGKLIKRFNKESQEAKIQKEKDELKKVESRRNKAKIRWLELREKLLQMGPQKLGETIEDNYFKSLLDAGMKFILSDYITRRGISPDIVLISKCGHILGDSKRVKEWSQRADANAVVLSESAAHCISPKFIESEIDSSLQRLGVDKIDIYMINCPERLLAGKLRNQQVTNVYPHIKEAFQHLEHEVKRGRIGSYGISSNSIANPSVPDYINIQQCISIAKEVGGTDTHAFSCIEYPLNLFERDAVESSDGGKVLAEIAEENNLYQFTQRPLNVIAGGSIRCLGDKRSGYDDEATITAALTTHFERVTELESDLSALVGDTPEDINTVAHFIWAETLADNLAKLISSNSFATTHYVNTTVLPTLASDIDVLLSSLAPDAHNTAAIQKWAQEYKKSINELCTLLIEMCQAAESATNREIASVLGAMAPSAVRQWRNVTFTENGKDVDMFAAVPLSDLAIRLIRAALELKTNGRGGTILVGMRKPKYVPAAVVAGSGGSVSADDVESAFLCSLLDGE